MSNFKYVPRRYFTNSEKCESYKTIINFKIVNLIWPMSELTLNL